MALFRRFFYRKPPDRLLEISERVYVFDCCFSSDIVEEDDYKTYLGGIVAQLQDHYPDASFLVFNFREGDRRSQLSDVLSDYDMTVMDYPRQYEGCQLLPLEMIHHFLRSSESWLSLAGQQNVLLMHCERGGWPVLAFMLAGLLLYRKQYTGEQKTLEMVYKQAPKELLHLLSPLNPQPSQNRYLQYISRRNINSDWPPSDTPLALDYIILRALPLFDGGSGCRPVIRVYGQEPSQTSSRTTKLLFSSAKTDKHIRLYYQEECELVKLDVHCRVQGDVVLECVHLKEDLVAEEMMFRVMFHTAFIRSNVLTLSLDEVDVLWDAKDQFPGEFKVEVLFLDADNVPSIIGSEVMSEDEDEFDAAPEEFFEVEEIFSSAVDGVEGKGDFDALSLDESIQDDEKYEVIFKEDLEVHAFQDCSSDGGNPKQNMKMVYRDNAVNGSQEHHDLPDSAVQVVDIPNNHESEVAIRGSEEDESKQDGQEHQNLPDSAVQAIMPDSEEVESKQDGQEHRNLPDSEIQVADMSNNHEYEVIMHASEEDESKQNGQDISDPTNTELQDSRLSSVASSNKLKSISKKQPIPRSKSSVDGVTKNKLKQQESQSAPLRQAKPTAPSRWIPSNKGSYTNSMHVYYPPSRNNSAPDVLALAKDSQVGGKSKASSSNRSDKYSACPSSADTSPTRPFPSAASRSPKLVELKDQESCSVSEPQTEAPLFSEIPLSSNSELPLSPPGPSLEVCQSLPPLTQSPISSITENIPKLLPPSPPPPPPPPPPWSLTAAGTSISEVSPSSLPPPPPSRSVDTPHIYASPPPPPIVSEGAPPQPPPPTISGLSPPSPFRATPPPPPSTSTSTSTSFLWSLVVTTSTCIFSFPTTRISFL